MAYSSPMKDGAKKVDVAKLRMFLEKELMAQEERISQATRALAYCQERPEFAGSREEVREFFIIFVLQVSIWKITVIEKRNVVQHCSILPPFLKIYW